MASLIKNQIVKHLSKFTKNFSPDKIQLSTLKGEGELTNLELNEDVLMELMDLPTWLKLTKAVCNKVNIKMQISKLKSQPIQLFLDEIQVSMEMCEELRPPSKSELPSYSSGGRYSFGDRVVDGMYLQINAVIIKFTSKAFDASLNLSRIVIQSKTPTWRTAADLQYTRISEKSSDLLLTFKEISWQTLKIEADCMVGEDKKQTTPLRLITNQSKIRISVKKRYSVATKLQFIMDDLLWIITDSQMKAAVIFAKHLKDNMDKASEQSKQHVAQKLQNQRRSQQHKPATTQNRTSSANSSPVSSLFQKYDIPESSYQVQTGRIDLHLCDDINVEDRNRLVDGGAIGIAIMKLVISHYPMRAVGASRRMWAKYDDSMAGRDDWTAALIKNYMDQLKLDLKKGVLKPPQSETLESITDSLVERLTMLSVEDFFITTVSKERDESNRASKLFMSDKKTLFLPTEMSAIHVEHTEYFYSRTTAVPPPCPNVYIKLNPIKLVIDTYTLMWFNSFALSITKDVNELLLALPTDNEKKKERMEIRLEALMPKVVLPVVGPALPYQHDRPDSVQVLISRIIITNNHSAMCSKDTTLDAHRTLIGKYQKLSLNNTSGFPNNLSTDIELISPDHLCYASSGSISYVVDGNTTAVSEPQLEIMSIELEQFWMEFTGVKNSGSRPVSFLESFPVTIWIALPTEESSTCDKNGSSSAKSDKLKSGHGEMSVLIHIGAKICAQLNHYQYCFLMRLADSFTEMADTIAREANNHEELFSKDGHDGIIPTVRASTVLLHISEVQFAMLAKPSINISATTSSLEAISSPEELDLSACDAQSSFPSTIKIDEPDSTTEGNTIPIEGLPPDQTGDTDASSLYPLSSGGSDSGIASITNGSFSSSMETDIHLENSSFYHNPASTDFGPRKSNRSSFYGSDTLLPPPTEHSAGKKFTSAFTKMTSKMKSSINKVVDDSDSWDSVSIASGLSDDLDIAAELSGQEEEAAFTSTQTGGLNDDEHESINSASIVERPKQLLSVTIFKLCDIEVGVQTVGDDMVAKVLVGGLYNEDKGNVYYEEFQAQQLSDMTSYMKTLRGGDKPIRVRFSKGPAAAELADGAKEAGFAYIQVSDYCLSFFSSTVDKLGPLFKDEKIGEPLPILIEVTNFDLELKLSQQLDDASPVYNTDAPSIPIKLHINKVSVIRAMDGTITIQGDTLLSDKDSALKQKIGTMVEKSTNTTTSESKHEQAAAAILKESLQPTSSSAQLLQEMKYLQDENKALKEQILRLNDRLIEKDHEEFQRVEATSDGNFELLKDLEFYKKETKLLRAQILSNDDQVDSLQSANECLTETVKILKEEIDRKHPG